MFLISFFLIFLSEIGDKTQLLLLALSQRISFRSIFFGMTLSCFALNLLSVCAASWLCSCIPLRDIQCISALLFLLFGFHSLKPNRSARKKERSLCFAWLSVAIAFFIAELGDKTQLTTIALAAQNSEKAAVFCGSLLGLISSNLLVLAIGKSIFDHLPVPVLQLFAASVFFGFGSWTLFQLYTPTQLQIVIYCLSLFSLAYGYYLWQSSKVKDAH